MKGNCRNLIEHIETGMCSRCQGSGEIDDAEPGDISFNTADCGTCNGTGWQDKHDRYLTFETDKRKTMLMDALDAAKLDGLEGSDEVPQNNPGTPIHLQLGEYSIQIEGGKLTQITVGSVSNED